MEDFNFVNMKQSTNKRHCRNKSIVETTHSSLPKLLKIK